MLGRIWSSRASINMWTRLCIINVVAMTCAHAWKIHRVRRRRFGCFCCVELPVSALIILWPSIRQSYISVHNVIPRQKSMTRCDISCAVLNYRYNSYSMVFYTVFSMVFRHPSLFFSFLPSFFIFFVRSFFNRKYLKAIKQLHWLPYYFRLFEFI